MNETFYVWFNYTYKNHAHRNSFAFFLPTKTTKTTTKATKVTKWHMHIKVCSLWLSHSRIHRIVQCKTHFEWWLFILKIHYLFGITFTCMCKWMRKASFFMQQQNAADKCEKFRYGWKRVSFQFKYTHSVVIWHFANEKPMRFGCADYVPFLWFFVYIPD